jgi:hypothetical protein
MFQSKITESLNNLEKFVKDNEGTAEAQKALKTKAELEEVYNLVNKSLVDNGVNAEVANADAKVWQGIALWGSQETGLSPMEYINQRMPKVQKKRLADFLNERERRIATGNESELEILRQDINRLKKGVSRKASKGLRLAQFIKQQGGINDDRGDIKSMGASVGLLNKNGISLDEATFKAWEAGYIQSTERPEINQLLDLLSDDLGNHPVYSFEDKTTEDNRQYYLALEQALYEAGADINKDSLEVINQKLKAYENSLPKEEVIELDDFIPFQTVLAKKTDVSTNVDPKQIRKDAKKYLLDKVRKQDITHPKLGKIRVSRKGIDEFINTSGNIDKLALVPHLKELIETSRVGEKEDLTHPREDNIVAFYPLYNDAVIDGKPYDVTTKIGVDREGNLFYTVLLDENSSENGGVGNKSTVANEAINVSITPSAQNVNQNVQFQESLNIALENAELDKVNPKYEGETVNINGVERTVYNSNGDRIAMSELALRNFYNWFGDSKVVDEQGRPLVVYHGTNKEFDSFDKKLLGTTTLAYSARQGFFFTDSEDVANSYGDYAAIYQPINELRKKQEMAERWGDWDTVDELTIKIEELDRKISQTPANERGQKIYPVYLKAEDVLEYDAKDEYFSDIGDEINDVLLKAKKQGKDGVVLKNLKDQPLVFDEKSSNHFVVFEPNQIKSTSNRGTYSESDNIYFQSAFAGSRVDYDRPSLEAIGSGEGAQVHGWGLYYALNKDVAENYRKKFIEEEQQLKIVELASDTGLSTWDALDFVLGKKSLKDVEDFSNQRIGVYNSYIEQIYKDKDYDDKTKKEMASKWEEMKENAIAAVEKLKDVFQNKDKHLSSLGQVHEVDIPENPYLLDEDFTFSEQSEFVKDKLKEALTDNAFSKYFEGMSAEEFSSTEIDDFALGMTGGNIYDRISDLLGSDKDASLLLEKYGIKGISYDGQIDGSCFVIFNPDDVKVIQKFYQDAGRPKGAFAQNLDQKGVIYLFEDADASTFMHETAHFFRKELEEFGTARSKEMLQKMVEWENSEFDKRYDVQQTANGFVVTDKLGNVVYGDKKPFQSVQSAREYGRNEIFARGFEQYLRDGKAPSNYLKQAFRSFWSWLRSLYKSAKALNVDINDNIRSVYNEIIGGADLDFYLSAPVDEVLQQRVAESKDREEYLEDVIKRAQAKPHKGVSGWIKEKTESDKGLVKWWNAAIVPISTRAKRVNIKLRNRLRAYDYAVSNKYNEYMAQVKPFLDKWEKFSEQDAIAFDLALKNSYMKKQIDIVQKYDAYNEFVQVKNLLNSLFDQARDVGVELGYKSDYFPRQVEDVDGFMAYLHGSAMASQMRRALKNADPTNTFTTEEKAEYINKYLRGIDSKDLNKPLSGNVKDRIIDVITPEMNKYYKPSMQALISYIDGMNQSIESRRFWGFEHESINDSIGSMVSYLVDTGLIQPEQDAEVQEILKARFKAKGVTNKYLKKQKNLSYIYLMGGINSAITQIEDISVAIYKAGFWNTATSVFSKNRKGLSREELGLERIGQEFVESSTSSKAVSTVFKMTGLDKIDAFGKNTLINATFNKFQEMANKNEDALRARLEPILEQETKQTIQDIKKGEISENVKLLMFNELADMQPISLSEMPEYYLTSGNGRVFYMLKTFALKRIDIFRNECFDKIKQGNVKEGIQNLFRLSILMILCGMSKDAIINMLYGRDMDLPESFINNLLGLTGFLSKYSLYQLRDEGVGGFVSSVAIPPVFSIWSDLGRDIYKSLFTKKGKDISDYEVWKGLPLIGRFYYWWLGGGRTKLEKKKNKLK